jgi:hypothetical protein
MESKRGRGSKLLTELQDQESGELESWFIGLMNHLHLTN